MASSSRSSSPNKPSTLTPNNPTVKSVGPKAASSSGQGVSTLFIQSKVSTTRPRTSTTETVAKEVKGKEALKPQNGPTASNSKEGEGQATTLVREGMEEGYAMSLMATLFREYAAEGETGSSTMSRTVWISTHPSLKPDDVVDTVNENEDGYMRYKLEDKLLRKVVTTVTELQVFVQRMAALLPERNGSYFIVDPEEVVDKTLTGAQTMSQLYAAWMILTKRTEAAQRFIVKYQEEYKGEPSPSSPVSTSASLHKELQEISVRFCLPVSTHSRPL
ncbi:hypothetical protein CPC08DRAFT_771764 [Agrocybe pediades]|nr:hypothetical protein CPC08DRAFT_771764 [Agrocybe pediades]